MAEEWVNIIVNNGIAVGVVIYFCYMNFKYNQTILESLSVIKTMLDELKKEGGRNETE